MRLLNVTWFKEVIIASESFIFAGGFKVELLDEDDSLIAPLTESTNVDGYIDNDPTQQSATLELPTNECIGCSVSDYTSLILYLEF